MGIVWAMLAVFAFNAISVLCRWLFTTTKRRIWLSGRVPFSAGLAKLSALVAIATLVFAWIVGLIVGEPYAKIALGALIIGLVASGVLMLAANGLLDAVIVWRHFRGTLGATSKDVASRR